MGYEYDDSPVWLDVKKVLSSDSNKPRYTYLAKIHTEKDDISVIKEMILKFITGIDVVYGVRKERTTDTFFKRNTALIFYNIMKKMKVNIIYNHADKKDNENIIMILFRYSLFSCIRVKKCKCYVLS